MTQMERPHYGGNPRIKETPANLGGMRADCTAANIPADKPGYSKGCILQVYDGSNGNVLYVNTGTKTSCAFKAIPNSSNGTLSGSPLVLNGVTYTALQLNSVEALRLDDAAISGLVVSGDNDAKSVFLATADGGVAGADVGHSGGNVTITGGAGSAALVSGGAAGGNGATLSLVAQAGGAGDGAGATGIGGGIRLNSALGAGGVIFKQAAPVASSTTTPTLTVAALLNGLITSTNAGAVTATLDTGTAMDAGRPNNMGTDEGFFWSIINLGSSSGTVTVTASSAHTVVGLMTVAINTQRRFFSRRTAANTWVTYSVS